MPEKNKPIPKRVFAPTLCVTHKSNLNCVYCYQSHDSSSMSFDTAIKCLLWIYDNIPQGSTSLHIDFIGGEPLIEFSLIKSIYEYMEKNPPSIPWLLFATTNGTLLTNDMKRWFGEHKSKVILGLSLDGTKDSQDFNRSNSFDKIDLRFFLETYPKEGLKMTISEYSLSHLAENIIYIHKLGFSSINGVNLYEGDVDWDLPKYTKTLIEQLTILSDFYINNDNLELNQMLNLSLDKCESVHRKQIWCGIGTGCVFFDVDGKKYPCSFSTPMTFNKESLSILQSTDFSCVENFIDSDCFENCYLYPICPNCTASNFKVTGRFNYRDKRRCLSRKIIALFVANIIGHRLIKNPNRFSKNKIAKIVKAICNIKKYYSHLLTEN